MIAEYFVYFSEGPAITFLMNSEKNTRQQHGVKQNNRDDVCSL